MQAFSLWVEFETRKVKPTEEVLYSEKIQLVRVREVASSLRKKTQELHLQWPLAQLKIWCLQLSQKMSKVFMIPVTLAFSISVIGK